MDDWIQEFSITDSGSSYSDGAVSSSVIGSSCISSFKRSKVVSPKNATFNVGSGCFATILSGSDGGVPNFLENLLSSTLFGSELVPNIFSYVGAFWLDALSCRGVKFGAPSYVGAFDLMLLVVGA